MRLLCPSAARPSRGGCVGVQRDEWGLLSGATCRVCARTHVSFTHARVQGVSPTCICTFGTLKEARGHSRCSGAGGSCAAAGKRSLTCRRAGRSCRCCWMGHRTFSHWREPSEPLPSRGCPGAGVVPAQAHPQHCTRWMHAIHGISRTTPQPTRRLADRGCTQLDMCTFCVYASYTNRYPRAPEGKVALAESPLRDMQCMRVRCV